jgi:hypothetical protein
MQPLRSSHDAGMSVNIGHCGYGADLRLSLNHNSAGDALLHRLRCLFRGYSCSGSARGMVKAKMLPAASRSTATLPP